MNHHDTRGVVLSDPLVRSLQHWLADVQQPGFEIVARRLPQTNRIVSGTASTEPAERESTLPRPPG